MKNSHFLILNALILFLVIGCAHIPSVNTTLQDLYSRGEGAILTVNLKTNQRVRNEQICELIIDSNTKEGLHLKLQNGENHYALNISSGIYQIRKISCGIFYFYGLKKDLHAFEIHPQKISYLGGFEISLEPKAVLNLTMYAKGEKEMREKLVEMNLIDQNIILDPL